MSASPQETIQVTQLKSTVTSLAVLNRLILETLLRESKREVEFHILNRTISFIPYDRAVLVEFPSRKLLGFSGTDQPDKQSSLYQQIKELIDSLQNTGHPHCLNAEDFTQASAWEEYHNAPTKPEVLWLPLAKGKNDQPLWGLWLERWKEKTWAEDEVKALSPLTTAYGQILKQWTHQHDNNKLSGKIKKHWIIGFIVVALLLCVPLRLRIVAPCEIIPLDPITVAARTEGVVNKVLVKPGQVVHKGNELVAFERDVAREEYKAALQQVRISESDLTRAEVKSLNDLASRESLQLLNNRLKQEKTRLEIASKRLQWLELKAPADGTVLMSDPHEWQGRPVQTGERIMLLVDPHKNKVRINLPPDDRLDFTRGTEVRVFLNSDSGLSRKASLDYLSQYASISSTGNPVFLADAMWDQPQQGVIGGMKGTAIVYGRKVPLFYWLLRKPLGALRRYLGV